MVWRGRLAYYRSRDGQLPVRWTAPEALGTRKFNEMTDVWSFGVLMYELWTRTSLSYGGWGNQRVWVAVTEGHRLEQLKGCSDEVYTIMRRCWETKQSARPTLAQVVVDLRALYQQVVGESSSPYCTRAPKQL